MLIKSDPVDLGLPPLVAACTAGKGRQGRFIRG